MNFRMLLAGAVLLAAAAPLPAQTSPVIAAARAAGQVGERYDGFLGYVQTPGPAVRAQVEGVNIRRRSLFTSLAAKRGASPHEVGIAAGCQLLASVAVGEAYMMADNVWRRRGPGQSIPVPAYCQP